MTKRPSPSLSQPRELDETEIKNAVLYGVADYRKESGDAVHVAEILYTENDTFVFGLFAHCAHLLAEHHFAGAKKRE